MHFLCTEKENEGINWLKTVMKDEHGFKAALGGFC
jgi:hypothetical protein